MSGVQQNKLSRRERQIMDAIYSLGECTAQQVMDNIPDPPQYATVRKLLRIMEEKGYLKHRRESHHYLYSPTLSRKAASKEAMKRTVDTFYNGSLPKAFAALLDLPDHTIKEEDIAELRLLIEEASKKESP